MPYADNQGIRIHYEVEGHGPPLVLMHGLTGSLDNWRDFGYVEALKSDYILIMLDGRGHGTSDKPHDPDAYDMKLRAADIVAVMDDLQIGKTHFLGYSTGATIGFSLAKYNSQRVHSLILGGEHPYDNEEGRKKLHQRLSHGMEPFVTQLEERYGPLPPASKDQMLTNDLQAILATTPHEWPGFADVLPRMTMPCLVYVGEEDAGAYSGLKQAVEHMPNTTFISLAGINHWEGYVRSDLVLPHVKKFLETVNQQQPGVEGQI